MRIVLRGVYPDEGVTGTGWSAIISCTGTSDVENVNQSEILEIFPNPSNGIFYLKTNFDYSEISLTNVIGEEIFKTANQHVEEINLSDQPNGIYFLKIKTNQKVLTRKLIMSK